MITTSHLTVFIVIDLPNNFKYRATGRQKIRSRNLFSLRNIFSSQIIYLAFLFYSNHPHFTPFDGQFTDRCFTNPNPGKKLQIKISLIKMFTMKASTERKIIRWMHILLSIPVIGFIYGPVANIPEAAAAVRYVFFPIIVLSGFYLWKGHLLRKLLRRKPVL